MSDPNVHSKLARELMRSSGVLGDKNVEIVLTTLSKNSAKMVLFYTLVRGLQSAFPHVPSEPEEHESLVNYLTEFLAELNRVRSNEVALLSLERRQHARTQSIGDLAITWVAYFRLAATLRNDPDWKDKLAILGAPYNQEGYAGDLLSRQNPLWQQRGILAPDPTKGNFKVISNRNAQQQLAATLAAIVNPDQVASA